MAPTTWMESHDGLYPGLPVRTRATTRSGHKKCRRSFERTRTILEQQRCCLVFPAHRVDTCCPAFVHPVFENESRKQQAPGVTACGSQTQTFRRKQHRGGRVIEPSS